MSGGVGRSTGKMGAPRARKRLIKSRRRPEDDDGEEEGSVAAGLEDDSLSEASAISDADDDADVEGSDGSDLASPVTKDSEAAVVTNGHRDEPHPSSQTVSSEPEKAPNQGIVTDTEQMMNGLKISQDAEAEAVNFDDLVAASDPSAHGALAEPNIQPGGTAAERSRREHDEYKKRRDADPAFVPNRGGFFMHDHRSSAPGQNGFRPFGRGKARGRGNGLFPTFGQFQNGPADAPWAHDLHETLAQEEIPSPGAALATNQDRQRPPAAVAKAQLPNRSFSGSRLVGNVQIRILLNGMTEPITFSAVPVNQHTRLPHHRPPLRRDKPVRISIPEAPIRYIFPATERSFIFIPRALRPNQQGFGRVRGRGSFAGSFSGLGPLSSRRTSVYAGSGYSPSVAMSRRSSVAREMNVDGVPASSGQFPRPAGIVMDAGKPVVRLPPAAVQLQAGNQHLAPSVAGPTVNLPQASYPNAPRPIMGQAGPESLPIHHPKPERTLQVGDIDSPATLEFNPPQPQQQQPFHQQMPQLAPYQPDSSHFIHSRHQSHPSQVGTPLQHIPETAIHAQPFQPYPYPQQQQGFYAQPYPPPLYYFPPAPSAGESSGPAAAPFVPSQQYYYPVPLPTAPQPSGPEQASRNQTVAHESGGMVYYYSPADLARNTENPPAQYAQPTYGTAPMGMGEMMPFYPQAPVYYPPQPPPQ